MRKNELQLKKLKEYEKNIKRALNNFVEVGILKEKATSVIYSKKNDNASKKSRVSKKRKKTAGKNVNNQKPITVVEIGAIHEFGAPDQNIPVRSFLKFPVTKKQKDIEKIINKQFQLVVKEGKDAVKALSVVGIGVEGIIQDAFKTGGFGQWKELKPMTVQLKKSSAILIDTGTLRNSIASAVRKKNNVT